MQCASMLTIPEAAAALGYSTRQIYNLIRTGIIKARKHKINGRLCIPESEVTRLKTATVPA